MEPHLTEEQINQALSYEPGVEQAGDAEILQHLVHCDKCRDVVAQERELIEGVQKRLVPKDGV